MERLLQFDPPPAVRRALRWYRNGVQDLISEDQFQYFWFALEILAEYQKTPDKVTDKCPHCKSSLYCETCQTHPTHRPYVKQAIRSLILAVEGTCDEKTLEALDKARNGLMHGSTLSEIEDALLKSDEHIVDVLGKIVLKALIHQFPKELFKEKSHFGLPSTYLHGAMESIAHVSTIVPNGTDGELDLNSLTGIEVSMVTDGPPQSGRPTVIVMTSEQHEQLGVLRHESSDHQELCERVYERVKMGDGKVAALVLSTDMDRIREALKHGETGKWQDLFREILGAHPSSGGSMFR